MCDNRNVKNVPDLNVHICEFAAIINICNFSSKCLLTG